MLDRMTAGTVPDKPHTALRDDGGRLRHEECLTRDGFEGPFTIMYHAERPHTAAVANAAHGVRPGPSSIRCSVPSPVARTVRTPSATSASNRPSNDRASHRRSGAGSGAPVSTS